MSNKIHKKNYISRHLIITTISFTISLLAFFSSSCHKSQDESSSISSAWTGTWGTAQQLVEPRNMPPEPGLSNNTLRQVVRSSIGGEKLRVKFSNEHSSKSVTLKAVHIAASMGGDSIDPETDVKLSFNGKPVTTIDPGSTVTSDPFHFLLKPRSDVALTIHLGETSPDVTGHPGSRTTSFLQAGDMADAISLPDAAKTDHWYIIDSIEVMAPKTAKAVVVIGDSITDGRGSGTNKQNRWPDELARRLKENPETADIAVLNMGIGGNCVLRDCLGPAATTRFENDVLEQSGVRWLIILEGINDIGQARGEEAAAGVAKNLIAAYEQMIDLAHNKNIQVYGATLLPFGGSFYDGKWREAARLTVNEWIRTSMQFDAVIDLDKALGDPEDPTRMLSAGDTGDHLHPNETGHRMMAEAVDLELFKAENKN